MDIIRSIEHEQMKNKIPALKVGDTVKVHVRVKEGNRERIQVFEGIVIKKQGGGSNATFTVRRISYGVGVEKTFLIHSPKVEKVEVTRIGKARRAKLYYLRERLGKSAKTKEKMGARIETNEIVLKEELVEEEVIEEVSAEEVAAPEVIEASVTEEAPVEEMPAKEAVVETPEVKKEISAEEPAAGTAPEEAPAVETAEPVVQEPVDTVKEEPVEEVKEEPVNPQG